MFPHFSDIFWIYFFTFRLFRRDCSNRRARSYTLYRIDHSNSPTVTKYTFVNIFEYSVDDQDTQYHNVTMIPKRFYFLFLTKRCQIIQLIQMVQTVQIVRRTPDQTSWMNFRFDEINFLPSWSFTWRHFISASISKHFRRTGNYSSLNTCNRYERSMQKR
jgi:hypothetical protein